ncbi:hypothetical protein Holit_03071 [Hollandina sp. SP2]
MFDDFLNPVIDRFNGVGRIYHLPDFRGTLEKRDDLSPPVSQGCCNHRVVGILDPGELIQVNAGQFHRRRKLYRFQTPTYPLPLLVRDKPDRSANQVDSDFSPHTYLDIGLREHRSDGIGKAGQAVNSGTEDVRTPRFFSSFILSIQNENQRFDAPSFCSIHSPCETLFCPALFVRLTARQAPHTRIF